MVLLFGITSDLAPLSVAGRNFMSGNETQKSVNNVFTKMHSITKCIINKKICASQHIVWPLRWKQQENFTISRHSTKPADQTLRSILKFLEYNQNRGAMDFDKKI